MREGWTYKTFGEVGSFSRGLTYSKNDVAVESSKKVLRSNNIDLATHSLNFDDVACLKEEFVIPFDKKLRQNDIFICMSNGSTQHLGKVAFIEKDLDYAFGGFMGAIHPQPSVVYPKFAFFYCMSAEYRRSLASVLNGININNLKWSDLSKFPIPIPPLSEQQHIVSELDLLSSIIEKKKAQLKEYDQLAQSIFYDVFGDPVTNEKGWEVKKLGEVCEILAGGDKPANISNVRTKDYCFPVIANGDGEKGILGYSRTRRIIKDSVTIGARGASIGNCRIVYGGFTPVVRLITLTPDSSVNCSYLFYFANLMPYNSNGAGQAQLTVPNVRNVSFPLPPLTLQQSFASKIEEIERQKALIQQSIIETETLFNSRMDYYFN